MGSSPRDRGPGAWWAIAGHYFHLVGNCPRTVLVNTQGPKTEKEKYVFLLFFSVIKRIGCYGKQSIESKKRDMMTLAVFCKTAIMGIQAVMSEKFCL